MECWIFAKKTGKKIGPKIGEKKGFKFIFWISQIFQLFVINWYRWRKDEKSKLGFLYDLYLISIISKNDDPGQREFIGKVKQELHPW